MRKILFKLHRYMALVAMLPLVLIAVSGSLLVFKFEIDSLLMPEQVTLPATTSPGQRQHLNQLVATLHQQLPDYEIGSWELFDDGHEADRVYLIRRGTDQWFKVYLNPYQGQLLSQPVGLHSDLTDWLLELHYSLLLNDWLDGQPHLGLLLGLVVALLLCLLGLSGLVIYRQFWRRLFSLRWDQRLVVMMSDSHKLVGIWSAPLLLVLGITGGYFNLMEYWHEAIEHGDEPHHQLTQRLYNDQLDLQALVDDSRQQLAGFEPRYLLMPYEPGLAITLFGHQPTANPLASGYGSTVSYDPHSGALQGRFELGEADAATQLVDSFRKLHFGNFAGLASKILWSLAGLAPLVLAVTGLYLWQRRHHGRRRARQQRQVGARAEGS